MRRSSRPRRASAFTLLEVLAAVALLGIVYTTLARVAAIWLRAEGEARRRFEASLAADRRLAAIEAQAAAGTLPQVGEELIEEDPFRIETRVEEFSLPLELFEPAGSAAPRPERPERAGEAPAASTLFPRLGSQVGSPLRRIDVRVAWDEGPEEQHVERTTLLFDRAAAAPALAAIPRPQGSP